MATDKHQVRDRLYNLLTASMLDGISTDFKGSKADMAKNDEKLAAVQDKQKKIDAFLSPAGDKDLDILFELGREFGFGNLAILIKKMGERELKIIKKLQSLVM